MTNPEMLESQEVGWWDDIKEWLKNLRDSMAPFYTANKKADDLSDFIYKKSLERTEKSLPLIKNQKKAILYYKNKNWEICNISTTKKTIMRNRYEQSISVNVWNKYLCLNWRFMKPSDSDWRWNSDYFYLTDKNWRIVEDNLEPERAEKVLGYIQKKVDEYNQIADQKFAQMME